MKGLGVACSVFAVVFLVAAFPFGIGAIWADDPSIAENLWGTATTGMLIAILFGVAAGELFTSVKK